MATLAVETLSCLVGPSHPLAVTPCYWDLALLPGRVTLEVVQAVARLVVRLASELIR